MIKMWGDMPINSPEEVGYGLLLPVTRDSINGKTFFVAGGKIVEFEDKLGELQPLWMGEELSARVNEGQRRLIPRS